MDTSGIVLPFALPTVSKLHNLHFRWSALCHNVYIGLIVTVNLQGCLPRTLANHGRAEVFLPSRARVFNSHIVIIIIIIIIIVILVVIVVFVVNPRKLRRK